MEFLLKFYGVVFLNFELNLLREIQVLSMIVNL